jgi:hypothetical protein
MQAVPATRVALFLQWLRCLLFEMLLEAVHTEDRSEDLWRAALGCLLHLVASGGTPDLSRMAGLSASPLAVLLSVAEDNAWYGIVSPCLWSRSAALMVTDGAVPCLLFWSVEPFPRLSTNTLACTRGASKRGASKECRFTLARVLEGPGKPAMLVLTTTGGRSAPLYVPHGRPDRRMRCSQSH